MRAMPSERITFSSIITGALVLCLLVSALSWSLHAGAVVSAGDTASAVQMDADSSGDATDASNNLSENSVDPYSHGELHFFGLVPTLRRAIAPTGTILNRRFRLRYTNPHPQPLIFPPIA